MNFTGERVIPGEVDADLFNEHRARYLFARQFAAGKRVLDAACGSGYGSALLAEAASSVLGIDIAKDAVDYANQHYLSSNTRFEQADCLNIPYPEAQFDLITAFEIIEHLQDAPAFLREIRRVLVPGGLLLLSTPNRLYYTEDRGEINPFHYQEYSYSEVQELLAETFPNFSILLENHVSGLLIADALQAGKLAGQPPECLQADASGKAVEAREREAFYFLAVASTQSLPAVRPLLYLPSAGNVLREREMHIRQLEKQVDETRQDREMARSHLAQRETDLAARTAWAEDLNREVHEKAQYILDLQQQYDDRSKWAVQLQQELGEARCALEKLQQEFDERSRWALQVDAELKERTEWALRLDAELSERKEWTQRLDAEFKERTEWALRLDAELKERTEWALRLRSELQARNEDLRILLGSRWYKLGKNLRLSPVPPADQGSEPSS